MFMMLKVEELDINSVSDIDMENFNKVNEFIALKSVDKKVENQYRGETPSFDTNFENMYKEPLAKERESKDKNKLISVLDDYYMSNVYFYNRILVDIL